MESPAGSASDLHGKKAGALLALLALTPGRMRSREELTDLLWPEVDFDEARVRFRQQLTFLRKLLEPEGVLPNSVLVADRVRVGLAESVTSDVARFQQHLRQASLAKDPTVQAAQLHAALELYKGEFAPGFYLDAILTERERLAQLAAKSRERLGQLESTLSLEEPPSSLPPTAPVRVVAPSRTANRFFGRQGEQGHLRHLLERHRLVTLLGPGGTGKTRLVQELQAELPDSHFIALSALSDGSRLLEALVAALGLPDSTELPLVRLKAALRSAPCLLILDNFEQLVANQGAEALALLLEELPTLRCLVTSRLRLSLPQECVCRLAPLPHDDALALFCDRAQLARSTFTCTEESAPQIAELCRHLDGLPLAIELAAARISVLSPQQILERLSRRFDLLADRRRDRDERHTSLRAALDWGWSLLAPDLQHFFTSLCLFEGSFSLEAAEQITLEPLALDYLQSLVDASLLLVDAERFWLLETLREYGLEKLDPEERERLRKAHFDFYFQCVVRWRPLLNGSAFAQGMAGYKQDRDNILAALDRALVASPAEGVELCLKSSYFWQCAYWNRLALKYLNQAIVAVGENGLSEVLLNRLHTTIGYAYMRVQEYETARGFYEQAYHYDLAALEREAHAGADAVVLNDLKRSIAGLLHNLGILHYQERAYEAAVQCFTEALELNVALGNDSWRSRNLESLGSICSQRALEETEPEHRTALLETAMGYYEEAIVLCRRLQEQSYLCHLLQKKCYLLQLQEHFGEAIPLLEEGLSLACSLEQWGVLIGFCSIYQHQAQLERRWEEAAQFEGAVQGLGQRWETESYLREDSHLRPAVDLPRLLGAEAYAFLQEAGAHASLEALQTLARQLHQPPARQPQVGQAV